MPGTCVKEFASACSVRSLEPVNRGIFALLVDAQLYGQQRTSGDIAGDERHASAKEGGIGLATRLAFVFSFKRGITAVNSDRGS